MHVRDRDVFSVRFIAVSAVIGQSLVAVNDHVLLELDLSQASGVPVSRPSRAWN